MYHQWSPYAGARPSTRSQASCCTSVTPEKAIVGTAAETASTSRGILGDVRHQGLRTGAAHVVDAMRDDVDEAALALVAAAARPPRWAAASDAGDVTARAGLVAEHRQRRVSRARSPGSSARRLADQVLAAGLQPHHALQARVERRPRPRRWSRSARPSGSRGPGDRVVAADEPAVGQRAGQRRDGVEHRVATREAPGCGSREPRWTPTARRGAARRASRAARRVDPAASTQPAVGRCGSPCRRWRRRRGRRPRAGRSRSSSSGLPSVAYVGVAARCS